MKTIRIAEIARLANVTTGTVDRALHGRKGISTETRSRILEIARRVEYRPNIAARVLAAGRTPIRIGICLPRQIHYYFDQLQSGIEAEASLAEQLGVQTVWRRTDRLASGEVENVTELVQADLAVLILAAGSPQDLEPVIDDAEERGIRVICVDTDAPDSRRSSAVCIDAEASGNVAAEFLGDMVPPGAHVAVVTGMLSAEDHRKKAEAFAATYPRFCPNGVVVDIVEAHEDEEEAFQKCFNLMDRHPGLAGIYVSTVNCLPVCRAIGTRGLSGHIRLVTTDLFSEMRTYFERGMIAASVYSDPYAQGQLAMRLAVNHAVLGAPLRKVHYLAPQMVMRSTFHLFREMGAEPETESTIGQSTRRPRVIRSP